MAVSIVIPTWNGLGLLQEFLPSVIAAANRYSTRSRVPSEILIVDDGSADETVGWLLKEGFHENSEREALGREEGPSAGRVGLRFVSNKKNLGFGEACNRGFKLAAFPLVFLLNNDVEADVDCIAPLVENFADAFVFAAHCRVFEFDGGRECGTGKLGSFARGFIRVHRSYAASGRRQPSDAQSAISAHGESKGQLTPGVSKSGPEVSDPQPLYSMFAGGGSAMFDRQRFLEIGGFDTLLTPYYWEDVELSYRAWKRGYTVLYEPRSVTRHRVSSTIGKLDRKKVRAIEQRNRIVYHWIHLQDSGMLASHLAWLAVLAITAPLRLSPGFVVACMAALRRLPEIQRRRMEEKRAQVRSDREVFAIFRAMESRADVTPYDDDKELASPAG